LSFLILMALSHFRKISTVLNNPEYKNPMESIIKYHFCLLIQGAIPL